MQRCTSSIEASGGHHATPSPARADGAVVIAKQQIFVVEDHPIFRNGIVETILAESDLAVCGEADSAPQAIAALRERNADAVVLDLSLHGADGLELLKQIRAEHPKLPALILSMHDENTYALRAFRAGAGGY